MTFLSGSESVVDDGREGTRERKVTGCILRRSLFT
jgi:hypothetical protein